MLITDDDQYSVDFYSNSVSIVNQSSIQGKKDYHGLQQVTEQDQEEHQNTYTNFNSTNNEYVS